MRVLIGTPIHQCKDYCMERWLQNVAELQKQTPADLLLVDNSPEPDYAEKVREYCNKHKIKNYAIRHLDTGRDLSINVRIEASQETIRRHAISCGYDIWFSWECDQIIPRDSLDKLMEIMKSGNYFSVIHNSQARWDPSVVNVNMGITLLSRKCLEQTYFLPDKNGAISLDPADSFDINDPRVFKERITAGGGKYAEVFGVLNPIYHLDSPPRQ